MLLMKLTASSTGQKEVCIPNSRPLTPGHRSVGGGSGLIFLLTKQKFWVKQF